MGESLRSAGRPAARVAAWAGGAFVLAFGFGALVFPSIRRRTIILDGWPVPIALEPTYAVEGPFDAPITVVEYSDLECPFSIRNHAAVYGLLERYPGKVRYRLRHFPLPRHKNAHLLARAVCAAEDQGRGAAMRERLFGLPREMRKVLADTAEWDTLLVALAGELGLDTLRFRVDLHSVELEGRVQEQLEAGRALDVRSTPTVFVNGSEIRGAVGSETYRAVVDKLLIRTAQ